LADAISVDALVAANLDRLGECRAKGPKRTLLANRSTDIIKACPCLFPAKRPKTLGSFHLRSF
jgi:hypothetical protein